MILLIDNYDSFSYNLVQLLGELREKKEEIKVIRNDEMTVAQIQQLKPSHIILSPGPKRPSDAGICEEFLKKQDGSTPILGVCLGHQAICEVYGAEIVYAKQLMHGKQSKIEINIKSPIFKGLQKEIFVARYHSLAANPEQMPDILQVIAREKEKGEIMAVKHRDFPIYGLQFHPESVLTKDGAEIMKNFLEIS